MVELCIVLPCRNEAETVGQSVVAVEAFLHGPGLVGEILVVDNGSVDGSDALAAAAGARVVCEPVRGYGNAIRRGVASTSAEYVGMADCDGSYDMRDFGPMLKLLAAGADLVIGNRYAGAIAPGAMPASHRLIGNPALNRLTAAVAGRRAGDVNCGIRAFRRQAIIELNLRSSGMELASEMIVRALQAGYDVRHVPVSLRPDDRVDSHSHLRPVRDGLRHLRALAVCGVQRGAAPERVST